MSIKKISQQSILNNLGFEHLNEIQHKTLKISNQKNILLIAPTGSGKTVAFLLVLLEKLQEKNGIQTLILAPTRELVLQIESVLKKMKVPFKVSACYGGHPFQVEKKNLKEPPTILIGTPGRIKDHINRGTIEPESIQTIIFDEFDKSLEFGFSKEMEFIVNKSINIENKILASATQSIEVPEYISFQNPKIVEVESKNTNYLTIKKWVTEKKEKFEGLTLLLNNLNTDENAIVFANHREACNRISEFIEKHNITHSLFHGGLEQKDRELELTKFRNGSTKVLIATDIAARGIDIPDLDFVIHYQIPPQESTFIHRNGRTARMKATGTSVLLMTDADYTPTYLDTEPELITLREDAKITTPAFRTIKINKGKKDKVNKVDYVGFFLQFDFMDKADLGLIEIKDFSSYVAVSQSKAKKLFSVIKDKKLKNKSPRFTIL